MSESQIRVFLMSANAAHVANVREALGCVGKNAESERAFRLETASRVDDALAQLRYGGIDIVLLDHTPPEDQVPTTLDRLLNAASLILVMQRQSARGDEGIISYVVRNSAVVEAAVNVRADIGWLKEGLRIALTSTLGLTALRTSETRFRAMSDASPLGVFMADTDGRCVYTNAAYEKISGLTFEQSTGTRWSGLVHPQDRKRVLAAWRDAVHGNRPFRSEFRIQRRDGSVAWTRVNGAAMYDGTPVHGHIRTVEDITVIR